MNKNKGFTLIELLIAIGIIAILSAVVIVAINPGQQFAAARDSVRDSDTSSIYQSLLSYRVSRAGGFPDIDLPSESKEICNTNHFDSEDCAENDLVDLSPLVPDYMNDIPIDPIAEQDELSTGYEIGINTINDVTVCAPLAETREVGVCETERRENDFACGDVLVDSRDGESYDTVMIGEQCWMAENLGYLPEVEPTQGDYSETDPYYYVIGYEGDDPEEAKENTFYSSRWDEYINGYEVAGVLYNWPAAMNESVESGAQGVCPDGWYLPTNEDWKILEGFTDSTYDYPDPVWENQAERGDDVGDNLTSTLHDEGNDTVGFNGLYAGRRTWDLGGGVTNFDSHGYFWLSDTYSPEDDDAFSRSISHNTTGVTRYNSYWGREMGLSVRCIKE